MDDQYAPPRRDKDGISNNQTIASHQLNDPTSLKVNSTPYSCAYG
jgi:hypothetical protein